MTEYRGRWSAAEVADFLDATPIPVRIATQRPNGSLWIVTLWFRYDDGVIECATSADAKIVQFLRDDPAVAVDVSTNQIPYRGIRASGRATIAPDEDKAVLRSLIDRYLEDRQSPLATRLLDDDREEVTIRIELDDVFSWDYSERMGAKSADGD